MKVFWYGCGLYLHTVLCNMFLYEISGFHLDAVEAFSHLG